MTISKNKVVNIEYTLTDNDGNVIDSTNNEGPLAYLHGHQNLIEGLELELEGKASGAKLKVKIAPEKAYGHRTDEAILDVPKANFPQAEELEVGSQIVGETEDGQELFTVIAINDDTITIDGNHPLAGQELNFEVEVVSIREATEEEISHGHIHQDGGSCEG